MVRVTDLYVTNADRKVFTKRLAWLDQRIAARDVNAAGSGFDRAERSALTRLLSQVEEKGKACDPPSTDAFDSRALSRAGWSVKYLGHSNPKPWTATRECVPKDRLTQFPEVDTIEAESFGELEALAAARDAQ